MLSHDELVVCRKRCYCNSLWVDNLFECLRSRLSQFLGKEPYPHWIIPTMTPNRPKALPKISTTKILTKESGFWASAIAHPDPDTPTQMLSYSICTHKKGCWTPPRCPSRTVNTRQKRIDRRLGIKNTDLRFFPGGWLPWWLRKWRRLSRRWRWVDAELPDQVLGTNTRSLDCCSKNACSCDVDTPEWRYWYHAAPTTLAPRAMPMPT